MKHVIDVKVGVFMLVKIPSSDWNNGKFNSFVSVQISALNDEYKLFRDDVSLGARYVL